MAQDNLGLLIRNVPISLNLVRCCREVTDQFVHDAGEKESYKKKVGDVLSYNKTTDRLVNGQTSTHLVIT
jgi:hypothetical protein